ncbi:MAG: hypothetical protein M3178_07250 [Pseudomonadota bacterium]|nr:hypothetical protein [Pseudomonadota bacterium]
MLQTILLNWKTSAGGFASVLAAVADILTAVSSGHPPNLAADLSAITAGIALLAAKDGNITGTAMN